MRPFEGTNSGDGVSRSQPIESGPNTTCHSSTLAYARPLKTPLEVRRVIEYVLKNRAHHAPVRAARFDECSSAAWFEGWSRPPPPALRTGPPLVSAPRSWLLRKGWARHGPIEA
jgi:hypothetical protein